LRLDPPYALYLGRVDRNKGCATLFEYFDTYLQEASSPASLVLAGPARMPVPPHPLIRALGFVGDAVRDGLLAHAAALVVPSPYESLSIALLEGWNHGVPALVNGNCRVLQGQVRRASGGLYYRSAGEFSAALDWLLAHPAEARALGAHGRQYVSREYRWPVVMARVEALLDEVLSRRRRG
jgi:glycosyltransferase involved in cell wall biosynthesis